MAREHLRDFRNLARERLSEPLRAGQALDVDSLRETLGELCRTAQAGGGSALALRDVAGLLFDLGLHLERLGKGGAPCRK